MVFATHLKRWRAEKFLTQSELAAALGVALSTVQKWEAGQTLPYPGTRRGMIAVLGIAPAELTAALNEGTGAVAANG